MTKYILHWWQTKIQNQNNQKFWEEIVKDIEKPKILIVPFASKDKADICLVLDKNKFKTALPNIQITYQLASKNIDFLKEQIQENNIIYIRGGDENPLLEIFGKIGKKSLTTLWAGKTIVGTSAGANFLAKYCYENDRNQLEEMFGILDIKTVCHYKWNKEIYDKLDKWNETLPVYALRETEFQVISC